MRSHGLRRLRLSTSFPKGLSPLFVGLFLGSVLSIITFPLLRFTPDASCSFLFSRPPRLQENDVVEGVPVSKPEKNYEPVMVRHVIKPRYIHSSKQPRRPRFAATELGIRQKLLVAVITSRSTALSLALALNRTSNRYVSKMLFFIEHDATDLLNSQHSSLNIIGIPSSSPSTDPLFALIYIARHFADVFDWFLLIPDHTYVPPFKAVQFVSSLSTAEDVVIGRPLKNHADVCSYDPGILLSNGVLKRMAPGLQSCISRSRSFAYGSYQLGHCIWDLTRMKCADELNGQKFSSWELPPNLAIGSTLAWLEKQADFERSISIFKVTSSADIFHLHKHFCEAEITQTEKQMQSIRQEIVQQAAVLNKTLTKPVGVSPPWRSENQYELLHWDFFTESDLFEATNPRNFRPFDGVHAKDVNNLLEACRARMLTDSPDLRFKRLLSGYRKFDPTRGIDYILDLIFDTPDGGEVYKRFLLLRPLNKVEIVPVPYVTEATLLWIILPVAVQDAPSAVRFVTAYKELFSSTSDNMRLTVLLLQEEDQSTDPFLQLVELIESRQLFHQGSAARVITYHYVKHVMHSPLVAVDFLMQANNDYQLCLVLSPWVILTEEFLNRVRMNVIQNFQVFFPVPFVRYHPSVIRNLGPAESKGGVTKDNGHFDDLDFSIAGFYRSDYVRHRKRIADAVGENNSLKADSSVVFGRFDVVDLFVNTDLHVMRAIDPALVVEHHDRPCDSRWADHLASRCETSRKECLGSKAQLAKLVLNHSLPVY